MKRVFAAVIIVGLMVCTVSDPSFGQLGVGFKVPSTEVFVATTLSSGLLLEAGVPVRPLTNGVFTVIVDGKLMISSFNVAGLLLVPFLGAGVAVTPLSAVVLVSPHGLVGAEFRLREPNLALFLELGVGVAFTSLGIAVGFSGQAGARLSF